LEYCLLFILKKTNSLAWNAGLGEDVHRLVYGTGGFRSWFNVF
jgi:hypothetical protein